MASPSLTITRAWRRVVTAAVVVAVAHLTHAAEVSQYSLTHSPALPQVPPVSLPPAHQLAFTTLRTPTSAFVSDDGRVLLSFFPSALDAVVFGSSTAAAWANDVATVLHAPAAQQHGAADTRIDVLEHSANSILVSAPVAVVHALVQHVPQYVEVVLQYQQRETPSTSKQYIPSHKVSAARLLNATRNIDYSHTIASLIDHLNATSYLQDVCILSGQVASSGQASTKRWKSRHSFSTGIVLASTWFKSQMEVTGAECDYFNYFMGFAPAVICKYASSLDEADERGRIVLSAHLDSRGTFGNLEAPGADDDGSGSAMLLNVARAIAAQGIRFKKPVYLIAFTGEEQGLWGSRFLANMWHESGIDVSLMLHADMIAFRKPGEKAQMAFPDRMYTPEAAWFVGNVTSLYQPKLELGTTRDQQSFFSAGYPAVWVFERNGPIADPKYHNSGDKCDREGYDADQATSISKALFASILEFAGFDFVLSG